MRPIQERLPFPDPIEIDHTRAERIERELQTNLRLYVAQHNVITGKDSEKVTLGLHVPTLLDNRFEEIPLQTTIGDLRQRMFSECVVPDPASFFTRTEHNISWTTLQKNGVVFAKTASLRQALVRHAKTKGTEMGDNKLTLHPEDRWFVTPKQEGRPINAAVLAMIDARNKKSLYEQYAARVFLSAMVQGIRTQHAGDVAVHFLVHDIDATSVSEQSAFQTSTRGETRASSAYTAALQLIDERYSPEQYAIYPVHLSSGSTTVLDLPVTEKTAKQLTTTAGRLYYGEVGEVPHERTVVENVLTRSFGNDARFRSFHITTKTNITRALHAVFS